MTLEVLFARSAQCSTFLWLCAVGLALGAALHAATAAHRHSRLLGSVLDVLCCLLAAAAVGWVLVWSGAGVRLYGVLGLMLGTLLYLTGICPLISAAVRLVPHRKKQDDTSEHGG